MAMTSGSSHQNHKHSSADAKHVLDAELLQCVQDNEPILRFAPSPNTVIHRPMVNLAEFLSSYSICLNSYEDRIGVTVKGEQLCTERLNSLKEIIRTNSKRQRHDSSSDKKSPEYKRARSDMTADRRADKHKLIDGTDEGKCTVVVGDDFGQTLKSNLIEIEGIAQIDMQDESDSKASIKTEENLDILATQQVETRVSDVTDAKLQTLPNSSIVQDIKIDSTESHTVDNVIAVDKPADQKQKKKETKAQTNKKKENKKESFRPLLNDETVRKIKKGWNLLDVGDLTIGDLYIMFGQDFRVNLEYSWMEQKKVAPLPIAENVVKAENKCENNVVNSENNISATIGTSAVNNSTPTNALGNKLKQLLLLANMTEKSKKKIKCSCSNYCDTGFKAMVIYFVQFF